MLLHDEGSRILRLIEEKKGGIKNLIFSSQFKNKGKLNALVCETLKYSAVLKDIIANSFIQKRTKNLKDDYLCRIVVYEFLFGKAENLPEKYLGTVKKNGTSLNAELAKMKIKMKISDNKDLVDSENIVKLPRYVRVNTLYMKIDEVLGFLKKENYTLMSSFAADYDSFLVKVKNLKENEFMKDPHLPELLIFPHGTSFYNHPLYEKGVLLLQDKASCLPALALAPPPNSQVIDTCGAPGNKTSYLAALMNNTGKIYAFDKDPKRFNTMGAMLFKAKVLNVEMKNEDFLKIKSDDPKYSAVEYILVDPSCSGSGIVDRFDITANDLSSKYAHDWKLESRLNSLMNFQAMLLNHALTFPNVKKVVYSTCSVHEQENESVIRDVLFKNQAFDLQKVFPNIPSRGLNKEGINDFDMSCCLRLNPSKDLTNGFFVACLMKKKDLGHSSVTMPHKSEIKMLPKKRKHESEEIIKDEKVTGEFQKRQKEGKRTKQIKLNHDITDVLSRENNDICPEISTMDGMKQCQKKERKLHNKRQRPKHKKPLIFVDKKGLVKQ